LPRSERGKECFFDVSSMAAVVYPLLYFLDAGGWFAAVLPAALLHELGHFLAVRALGGRIVCIRLDLSGVCMEVTPFPTRLAEVLSALAGPAAGLLWLFPAQRIGGDWGERSALAALAINLGNLLPALPLDGGRVLLAATGSSGAARFSSVLTAAVLTALSLRMRRTLLLLPAIAILRSAVRP